MALILTIECTSFNYSLALGDNGLCIDTIDMTNHNPTTYLSSDIIELLSRNKRNLRDLEAVALDVGPGSYSSLRSAVSILKGTVSGFDLPIIGLEKDFIIYGLFSKEEEVLTAISSLKTSLLLSYWNSKGQPVWKDKIYNTGESLNAEEFGSDLIIVGEKTDSIQFSSVISKLRRVELDLKASHWTQLAEEQFIKKNFVNPLSLLPKYLFEPSTTKAKNLL